MSWRSMFIEDDSSWPGLQFNPALGDTEKIDDLAADVKAVGDELEELRHLLKSVGERGGAWEGEAAERFSRKLGDLPKYLQQGTESMHDCAKALRTWHGRLQELQRKAERTETDAVEARNKHKDKENSYNALTKRYSGTMVTPEEADRINKMLEDAKGEIEQAETRVEELIREGERIHANWKDRAGEAERAILKASENSPPDLGVWGRISDALSEGWRDFKEWLIDNADTLSNWSAALAAAAVVVNALPIGGQIASAVLAGASVLCATGATAGKWMDNARGGKSSALDIGLSAAGMLPFGGAVFKGVTKGMEGAQGLAKLGGALKGAVSTNGFSGRLINALEEPLTLKVVNPLYKAVTHSDIPYAATVAATKTYSATVGFLESALGTTEDTQTVAPSGEKFNQALAA